MKGGDVLTDAFRSTEAFETATIINTEYRESTDDIHILNLSNLVSL